MAKLNVTFLGKELKNPLVVGSSPLTGTVANITKAAELGAGAVVLKSLFEEELRASAADFSFTGFHPEAYDAGVMDAGLMYGSRQYLDFIRDVKKAVTIPVFASVNCTGGKWWQSYAQDIASSGADGLELNISYVPFDVNTTASDVEKRYIETVATVKKVTNLPVSVKIGPWFTALPNMVRQLKDAGADAVTIFNRYYQLAYDIEHLTFKPYNVYSSGNDFAHVFRWLGILSSQVNIPIAATTGVHTYKSFVQQILAGATTVQMVSAFFKGGLDIIPEILTDVEKWMDAKGFASVDAMRGHIFKKNLEELKQLERLQYVKVAEGNF